MRQPSISFRLLPCPTSCLCCALAVHKELLLKYICVRVMVRVAQHFENCKYSSSTSKARAKILWNRIVRQ